MATDALQGLARARVRLVAIGARAVAGVSAGEFLHVTTLALLGLAAGVRLVATHTPLMTGADGGTLLRVTRIAGGVARRGRLMRQPRVTTLASGVAGTNRGQCHLRSMAALANRSLREVEFEVVRSVALLAVGAAVKGVLGLCCLMTGAAWASNHQRLLARWVGIVARQTSTAGGPLRVIGMDVPVAFGASRGGRRAHVMRRVAAGTNRMHRHFGLRQHDHCRVARTTGRGLVLLEFVRLVAAHALRVPARK